MTKNNYEYFESQVLKTDTEILEREFYRYKNIENDYNFYVTQEELKMKIDIILKELNKRK